MEEAIYIIGSKTYIAPQITMIDTKHIVHTFFDRIFVTRIAKPEETTYYGEEKEMPMLVL